MTNDFDDWRKKNAPGQAWTGRLLAMAAAGTATMAVWVSVVLMAGLDLPPGDQLSAAQAPAVASASSGRSVRQAAALPTVTVVGRREAAEPADASAAFTAPTPLGNATVGMSSGGDNLRQ